MEHNPLNPFTRRIVHRTPVDANAELLAPSGARRLVASAGFACLDTQFFLYLPESAFRRMPRLEALLSHLPLGGQYAAVCWKRIEGTSALAAVAVHRLTPSFKCEDNDLTR